MKKYAERKLELKRNNPIKEAFSLLLENKLTREQAIILIDDVYNTLYNMNDKNINDEHIKEVVENLIKSQKEDENKMEYFNDHPEEVKTFTFQAYVKEFPEYHRIISLPEFANLSSLVYAVLASFNFCLSTEYVLEYKNTLFKETLDILPEKVLSFSGADYVFLFGLEMQINDILNLSYDFDEWEIKIKLLDNTKQFIQDETELFVDALGPDPFEECKEAFKAVLKNEYDLAKELCDDEIHFHLLMEQYEESLKSNKNRDFERYYDILEQVQESFNYDYDEYDYDSDDEEDDYNYIDNDYDLTDEQLQKINELKQQKIKELEKLSIIKEYEKVKAVYTKVITEMIDYFQNNEDHYIKMMQNYFSTRRQGKKPKEMELIQVKLNERSTTNIMLSYIYPVGANYESVSQYFNRKNIFRNEEKEMLNSIIDSEYGIYKVLSHCFKEGTIKLKNLITNKIFDIVDKNLVTSLEFYPECPLFALRIIAYKGINFADGFELLMEDEEVTKYIEKIKKFLPSAIDFYFNVTTIANKQNN